MTTDHGRSAAMPALASAAGRPLHPSGAGRRSRGGFAWFRSLFGLPAGAGRALRTALPGLLALLVAAGLSAEVKAQTPTVPSTSPTEIYEGETLDFTLFVSPNYGREYIRGADYANVYAARGGDAGTAAEGSSNDWYLGSEGNRIAQLNHASHRATDRTDYYEITFRLHARADSDTEGDETIILYGYSYSSTFTVTITLKDGPRPVTSTDGVTLSGSALTLTELGSSSDAEKTYTVVLDTDPGANVVVTVASGDTSAVAVDTDSSTAGDQDTLTFTTSNWNAAQTVTLRALNDGNAAAETVTISHTAAVTDTNNAYHGIEIGDVTATTVDAGHGVVVSKASVSVTAGGATADYTIRLKSQPGGSVVVTPTSSATARATVSGALTFTNSNWSTPQTVTVTGAGAGSATISHMVTSGTTAYPTSTTIAPVTATVTAAANNAPTVANMIPDQTATVGTALSYAFPDNTFNDADGDGLTYSATKSDDTALPTWLTFTAGSRTFSGTPQAADVGTLSVKVTAADGNSGTISDTFDITVSHPARNLDIQVADAYEGENIVVTLTLSRAPGSVPAAERTIVVGTQAPSTSDVNTCITSHGCEAGSTPADASDFTATSTNVVFDASETVKTVSIPTVADSVSEGVEVVSIGILYLPATGDLGIFTDGSTEITGRNGFATNPLISPLSITVGSYGQILGDSRPVPITITEAGGTTVSEDGSTTTDTYTVVLDSQPSASVTVTATAGAGAQVQGPGGTAGGAATLTFTTTNWNQAQTITVTGVDDDIDNTGDARTVTIAHAASSTDSTYTIANAGEVSVTVTDDDTAGLVFTPDPVSVGEGATGSYTVALASEPSASVTVTITGQGGSTDLTLDTDSGMAGDQNTLTFTTSNWSAAQTVELTAAEDVDSNNDSITLVHAPTGGGYGSAQNKNLAVTITDDEGLTPVISMSLPSGESEMYTDDDELIRPESEGGTGVLFTVSADRPLPSTLTVCVRVTESGGDRVTSGNEGIKTVSLPSETLTTSSNTHSLTWTNTNTDDQDSSVTVEVVAPNTASCSATNGSYTVSSSDASGKLLIQDDESTTVELTSSDMTMTEGIAAHTATLTVSLSRQLYAGEVIAVPIMLATSTGARLPGSVDGGSTANHDFTVAASGTEVTLANALTSNPRLVFTGHGTNTVQTATVTLTPVAGRSDGDSTPETITATLTSLGATGLGTTVSGGAAAHSTNNAVSLTLAEPGTPGITLSKASPLRLLETGSTSYTVVLDAAPTHDVRVSVGRIGTMLGAASTDHTLLTFTTTNWSRPQTVTVTGQDESGTHRNRTLTITHGATSTDTRYANLPNTNLRVNVDDAPEVEAYWYIKGGAGGARIQRPHTITSTRGLTAWQNAAPGDRISYAVRLSNRPAPGGTVTVTATVPSGKRNLVGLSLTEGGTAQDTVTVEFKDRSSGAGTGCSNSFGLNTHQYYDSNGYQRRVTGGGPSESHDATPDTPWECWRMIHVVRKDASRNIDDTCADITHRASGGGVRKVTVDTIRAHILNPGRNWPGSRGRASRCRNVNGNTVSAPATAAPTPTEAVANVQVTAVDDTSASVTWDAVEHATSYDVSWSAESSDSLNASAGDLPGVTGTTITIDHGAPVPMTLTVTVTPEYVDKNGDTQQLASLAGTATLAVGPGSDALSASAESTDSQAPACVSDALLADARKAAGETWRSPGHVERWSRVLAAFGESNGYSPMTVAEAQAQADRGLQRWAPVPPALECLEKEPEEQPAQAEAQQAVPAITVTAGAGVTEGTAAGFTLKADPAPAEELAVTVAVAETGAIADASALGERIVTIPAGQAEAAFTVATQADEADEPAGAVVATVSDGAGYTVDDQGKSASVAVADDDATGVVLTAPAGDLPEASGSKTLTLTLGRALVEGESLAVPLAFAGTATLGADYTLAAPETAPAGVTYANLAGTDPKSPPTVTFAGAAGRKSATVATLVLATVADSVAEGERETVTVKPGTPVATGLGGGAAASGAAGFAILEPPPEIAIAAKTETVVEGADAAFTLTASRAPGADLTVRLTVSEADGSDFVAAEHEGTATATMPKGETEATFTVPTVNDTADEPDGAVTATLAGDGEKGRHYTVAAAPQDAASVKVADDDAVATAPTFSVGDETANEDVGLMYFTVRLDRAAKQTVKVTLTARESSPVSARYGEDYYWWWPDGLALTFHPGQTEKKMWVYVYNDNHDEDPETFEVALSRPTGGTVIGDGVAVGTIVNNDPMPAAWLARFGRTAAEQALDGIAGRIAASRTAGMQGSIAGQALNLDPGSTGSKSGGGSDQSGAASGNDLLAQSDVARAFGAGHGGFGTGGTGHDAHGFGPGSGPGQTFGQDRFGGSGTQAYSMTAREALLGSSFTATGEKDGTGGSLALWGRAAQSSFDGREGAFSLDGEATTAMLGADYARGNWLLGMALMQSSGEGGYRDTKPESRAVSQICAAAENGTENGGSQPVTHLCNGAVRAGNGEVEATLTAAVPYAALQASERMKLWGALGHGTGEVTLKPETSETSRPLTSDISWTMAALGLRGDVVAPKGSGPALAVTSDALWARTSSDKTHELAASDSDVTRLRLGLEGSWKVALEGNGSVTPKLEIGARHDGGDAETGFGVELGGGLAWVDPTLGLSLDLSGRTLVAHGSDDLEDRGFAASLAFDPDPATKRGLSLTLAQDWGGQAKGGLDALFTPQTLDRRGGSGAATARWQAEAAYGFPAFSGRFTGSPHMGLGLATGARDYSLGWRLTPAGNAPDLSFGLRVTRRESDAAAPEHAVGLEISAQW